MIDWWETALGPAETEAAADAIRKRYIARGPLTHELENGLAEFLGTQHAVLTTSGSVALLLALMARNIGPGDEVLVPNRTFMATANAPLLLGATVRLVDVEERCPVMSPASAEAAVTKNTKAILAVHRNGRAADIGALQSLAAPRGIAVIEDAAQAMGSKRGNACLGTETGLGAFSLGITKLITIGQGGLVATNDDALAERLRRLRNHGSLDARPTRYDEFGFNFRPADVLAGVGLKQLDSVADRMERLRAVYRFYQDALADIPYVRLIPVQMDEGELPLWAEVLCRKRGEVIPRLREQGIYAKPFLPSLSDAAYLKNETPFPNSRPFAEEGMVLPCGPDQPVANLEQTVEALRNIGAQLGLMDS